MILNSARVTKDAIQNQSFANLYNLINNRSNVPDPNDSEGNRKFVHVRMPRTGRNFSTNAGFPFIVVRSSRPTKGRSMVGITKTFRSYDMTIEVFTNDDDSNNLGDAKGAALREEIVDSIINTLDSPTNKKDLINRGMARLEYDIDDDDDFDVDGNTVFKAEFDIRFEGNLIAT